MVTAKPWGPMDWLIPKIGNKKWTSIVCTSFEDRCIAVPLWLNQKHQVTENHILRIETPINEYTHEINRRISKAESQLAGIPNRHHLNVDTFTIMSKLNGLVKAIGSKEVSVMLDISAMPKRAFLFLTKQLLLNENVTDLVICYTKPISYREGQLTNDALPPAALPGFARESENARSSTVIVSVGYMGFNLGDLLEQTKGKLLKFIFPFPPGSPSFRRNWRLLHQLTHPNIDIADIKRIHAMDFFAAYEWLKTLDFDDSRQIDMIPLGPKPHALAMGLAHLKFGHSSEIIYSQPQTYHPDYSTGIKQRQDGEPDITCYCLKKDSQTFI